MDETRGKGYALLIVDDEEGLRYGLEKLFERHGFTVYTAGNGQQAHAIADRYALDVALIDMRLKGGESGLDLLKALIRSEPDLVAVMITGYGSIDTAVAAMKDGAADYILKPIDNRNLLNVVFRSLEFRTLRRENVFLKDELLNQCQPYHCVTANPDMRALLRKADKIKDTPVTALITGESGTGKEVMARYMHFTSNRREGKFVSVNCAALSESLLLSELFGHEKGAFTGAINTKAGKFEIAHKGTLFLDEIGDMSLDIQAKLLRVIEEQSFERVGGVKKIVADVRLITATNKDLEQAIKAGKFREDLYYRINVVRLHLPPLRQRKDDIPLLLTHFIAKYNHKYHKSVLNFDDAALAALMAYDWPGNVRELENVVNNAVLLSERDLVGRDGLKQNVFSGAADQPPVIECAHIHSLKEATDKIVEQYEEAILRTFLQKNQYNKSQTARDLDITRKTLAQKIEKYQLECCNVS